MFAAAIGADLAVFDGGILFVAVLAIGDCFDGLDFKSATAQKIRAVCIPVPTINELIVHNRGYFADLHDDFLDFRRLVFDRDVAHYVRDMEDHPEFVHKLLILFGLFCRFFRSLMAFLRSLFFGRFLAESDFHTAFYGVR